jgi:hypothetical protein
VTTAKHAANAERVRTELHPTTRRSFFDVMFALHLS